MSSVEIIIQVLTWVSFGLSGVILFYMIRNYEKLSQSISVDQLAVIERDFPSLKQVVVVADQVEMPSGKLAVAVEDNFFEKVNYLFLVSERRAKEEVNGYFLLFEALAKKAIARMEKPVPVSDLVQMKKLSFDWDDVPHVFYQYVDEGGKLVTAAFRGDQSGEGIAARYEQFTDVRSILLASALLSNAPEEIRSDLEFVSIPDKMEEFEEWSSRPRRFKLN